MNLKIPIHHEGHEEHEAKTGGVRLCRTPYRFSHGSTESSNLRSEATAEDGRPTGFNGAKKTRESAVALVITLLMLSVITFLAIAFLAMTKRDRSAVTATLDVDTARSMSDAGLARAQASLMAQMMTAKDILSYDYTASHNFINPVGFSPGNGYFNNVNYDVLSNGPAFNPQSDPNWAQDWAQNINNLFYDPRPPVFVMTNGNLTQPANDFRYWVDINRNGKFESNGLVQMLDTGGNIIPGYVAAFNGEPEWIGVLRYPETNHSSSNQFIGRYAFMALPIGKTLDFNYIHNYSQYASGGVTVPKMNSLDGFSRDEGVGSWELNLGAVLNDVNTNPVINTSPYSYNYLNGNGGLSFAAAVSFLRFRYGQNIANLPSLQNYYGIYDLSQVGYNVVDEFGAFPALNYPFDYNQYGSPPNVPANLFTKPWAGSYNPNMLYDVQDLFDTSKLLYQVNPLYFSWVAAETYNDSYDRYTFQRLLSSIGMGSAPEYGVYVHDNTGNLVLRTKVNINYDNTAQIQAGPYSLMPTNLNSWSALGFFTNAGELLLRSQTFIFTNYATNAAGQFIVSTNYFGLTNIPVCMTNNRGIVSYLYNEQIHRMLQLAANIWDAANNQPQNPGITPSVYWPSVFRPELRWSNNVLMIVGYTQVVPTTPVYNTLIGNPGLKDITDPTIGTNDYVWGAPWVVGVNKGLPAFNRYSYTSRIFYNRELLFIRNTNSSGAPDTNHPPASTNQFYVMSISNSFGGDAWNPYTNAFYPASGAFTIYATNFVTITLTNNYGFATNFSFGNTYMTYTPLSFWPGGNVNIGSQPVAGQFKPFLETNLISLPLGYYSEHFGVYIPFNYSNSQYNVRDITAGFLQQDLGQKTGWPVHNWVLSVTNHVCYALFDGPLNTGALLDFVNLGPFGSSVSISNLARGSSYQGVATTGVVNSGILREFDESPASDAVNSPMSSGLHAQITDALNGYGNAPPVFYNSLIGTNPCIAGAFFTTSASQQNTVLTPYEVTDDVNEYVACDPLVHYTVGDLINPGYTGNEHSSQNCTYLAVPVTNAAGTVSTRYTPWPGTGTTALNNMLFIDPLITSANAWQFPTNKFPSVGWLGRVHRGTPWQTVYFKSDNPAGSANPNTTWATKWVNSQFTYPTNDWLLPDLFTAVPNDNAARGLLSVNQTNDAAWAAVLAGVMVITNNTTAIPLNPTNDVYNIVDASPNGLNVTRATNVNLSGLVDGQFHHVGDILQASALTVNSPYVMAFGGVPTDEMVERIPQQTLGLLKVGLPQFVIYSWGQSLKPKNLYSGGGNPSLINLCTNYEITGEYLTRTVCHVVSDPAAAAPKIVIDNFNIMPGN